MKKNLLLGNGVNQNTDSKKLNNCKIKDRFTYQYLNELPSIKYDDLRLELKNAISMIDLCNGNIEQIAANAYNYVKHAFCTKVGYFSGNHEYRIKRFLRRVALNSIFYDNKSFIYLSICPEVVKTINLYKTIMTLNYYEYWDSKEKAIYLHGKVKLDSNEVDDYSSCIFSPELTVKKSVSISIYPSEHLYPADDFIPMGVDNLYKELDGLNSIDIFGVSPYGDKELINKLVNIPEITIYVYDSNEEEIELWKSKLPQSVFINSELFKQ